jgi:GntR family transcriptional regulator, transcriptional repressor for pyruvate dehydrogenase complex
LQRVVGELFDERHSPLFEQLGSHFETAGSWAAAIREHQAVVDAIARHSAADARAAMATHLSNSHDRFTANIASAGAAETPPAPRRKPARKAA